MVEPKVVIVDYDIGNLFSVNKACEIMGMNVHISNELQIIRNADALILPGVGAYGDAMNNLISKGINEEIIQFAKTGKYIMGVCLGMQLLMSNSEEFGNQNGLGLVGGNCIKFPSSTDEVSKIKVPQIMWNSILPPNESPTFNSHSPLSGINIGEYMYFVHSYYVTPDHNNHILSTTDYCGIKYCSSIMKDNIFAFQFHPEKSGIKGLKIYENFRKIIQNK